ncbi:MAG: PAS domain S-box protein, partial [Desulfobulbaceae bacterium]|nr:PAS domain S-box protein [Desulfobulbaceae bacterium]
MSDSSEYLNKRIAVLEEKLHREQRRCTLYQEMVEQARDLLQSVRLDGSFAFVNKAWRQVLGYTKEEIDNLNLFDIIDPGEHSHCRSLFNELLSGRKLQEIETVFRARNGKKIHVSGKVNCKFVDGQPTITLGIFRDISDRKLVQEERERLIIELKEALARVKTLSGLLPICSSCKNIRDDRGYWKRIESYIMAHSDADFSHGICPDCAVEKFPEL